METAGLVTQVSRVQGISAKDMWPGLGTYMTSGKVCLVDGQQRAI